MKVNKIFAFLAGAIFCASAVLVSCNPKDTPGHLDWEDEKPTDDPSDDPSGERPIIKLSWEWEWGDSLVLSEAADLSEYKDVLDGYAVKIEDEEIVGWTVTGRLKGIGFGETMLRATPSAELIKANAPENVPDIEINVKVSSEFLMYVEDIFHIADRGTVVTGRISKGRVRTGQPFIFANVSDVKGVQNYQALGIEMFKKMLDEGQAGDNVGIWISTDNVTTQIERGAALYCEGNETIIRSNKIKGTTYKSTKAQGGTDDPFVRGTNYQIYIATIDVTAQLVDGALEVKAGETASGVIWQLIDGKTATYYQGMEISVRKDGRTLGTITVE